MPILGFRILGFLAIDLAVNLLKVMTLSVSCSCREVRDGEVKESESEAGERVLRSINNEKDTSAQSGNVASRSLSFTAGKQAKDNQ
jgi:hypothetical protein